MPPNDTVICIPARWAARRLPGKLARDWRGRPVLSWALCAARNAELGEVVLLADDNRLLEIGAAIPGVRCLRSTAPARNGSERIAAALAAGELGSPRRIVNVQGDAVGVTPAAIRTAAGALGTSGLPLATVAVPAVDDAHGRTTVDVRPGPPVHAAAFSRDPRWPFLHVGIYAYDPGILATVAALPPGPQEAAVSLEQLRWLEHGYGVAVAVLDAPAAVADAVDVGRDLRD